MYHALEFIILRDGTHLDRYEIRKMVVSCIKDIYWDKWPAVKENEVNRQIARGLKQQIDQIVLELDPSVTPVQNHTPLQLDLIEAWFTKHGEPKTYADEVMVQGINLRHI